MREKEVSSISKKRGELPYAKGKKRDRILIPKEEKKDKVYESGTNLRGDSSIHCESFPAVGSVKREPTTSSQRGKEGERWKRGGSPRERGELSRSSTAGRWRGRGR